MSGLDEALSGAVLGVTKKWAKQRKAEERNRRARHRRAQAFRPRASTLKAAAGEYMEQAYLKASASGTLPANARQIMYAARPYIQDTTGKDLNSNYLTQTLLPDYMASHATRNWNVVYDARGHFHEPHTDKTVALGTIEVRNYRHAQPEANDHVKRLSLDYPTSGPRHRFGATLFIEKEGFDELLEAAEIARRYDVAIMSTKGMSVTAARELVESLHHPLLVLHDFDQAGFKIIGTLRRSTRRYRFSMPPNIIDAGLRLSDIEEMGLDVEHQPCDQSVFKLRQNGASGADIDFLKTNARVELNAMSIHDAVTASLDDNDVRTTTAEATDWLQDYLTGGAALRVKVMSAGKSAGFSESALKRASKKLGVVITSRGYPRQSEWMLPSQASVSGSSSGESALTNLTVTARTDSPQP